MSWMRSRKNNYPRIMIRRAANRKWNKKIRIADPLWSSGPLGLAKDKTRIYFNIESAGKSKQSTLLINISFQRPPTKHEHPAFRPTHLQTAFGVALVLQKSRREEAVASSRTPRLSESHCQKLFSSLTQAGKRMDRNHLRAIHSQAICVVMFVQLSTPGTPWVIRHADRLEKKTHPAGRRYGSTKFRICQEHCWFIATRCYKYIIAHSRDYRMIYIYPSHKAQIHPLNFLPWAQCWPLGGSPVHSFWLAPSLSSAHRLLLPTLLAECIMGYHQQPRKEIVRRVTHYCKYHQIKSLYSWTKKLLNSIHTTACVQGKKYDFIQAESYLFGSLPGLDSRRSP